MNLNPMHSPDLDRSLTTGTGPTTGSWAQSTHSVIWRTNTGTPSHRMVGERIPWRPTLIACAAVALTVLLACANLVDVYGSFGLWAAAAVPAALIGAGIVPGEDMRRDVASRDEVTGIFGIRCRLD